MKRPKGKKKRQADPKIDAENLVVGDYYRTEGGRKIRIIHTEEAIIGLIQDDEGIGDTTLDDIIIYDGLLAYEGGNIGALFIYNIVDVWYEDIKVDWSKMPAWINYLAMDRNRHWFGYNLEPNFEGGYWGDENEEYVIPEPYYPEYKGDPKHSLVTRPVPV